MIGNQLTGEAPPWDMRAVDAFEQIAGKGLSLLSFSSALRRLQHDLPRLPNFPMIPMENAAQLRHDPLPQLGLAVGADEPQPARLTASPT